MHIHAFTLIPHNKFNFPLSVLLSERSSCLSSRKSIFIKMLSGEEEVDLVERYSDGFNRWKFLQDILEGDANVDIVNQALFQVLEGTKFERPAPNEDSNDNGSPEMTVELKEKIGKVLATAKDGRIHAFGDIEDYESKLELLEALLPDPVEEEEAFKSLWDTIIQIHGRESVKFNETNPTSEWKTNCLVARILLHFDFLVYGIVSGPLV